MAANSHDALGFPVEGQTAETCGRWVTDIRARGPVSAAGDFPLGQYTDDTQLARELAISICDHGRLDGDDWAERIKTLFGRHRVVGAGVACQASAVRMTAGVPWRDAGQPSPSAGNGTAMRAAPLGLLHQRDPIRIIEDARIESLPTHKDERCWAGSVAVATAVAIVLVDPDIEPQALIDRITEPVRGIHTGFANCIASVPDLLDFDVAEAAREVAPMGLIQRELDEQPYDWPGISPFVIPTVVWSLWSALKAGGDFMEAVLLAIEPGGDVDTTAAIAGAIAGARVGRSGLPHNLANLVHDGGTWRADELGELSGAVAAIKDPELDGQIRSFL